jgi:hypothetical protein
MGSYNAHYRSHHSIDQIVCAVSSRRCTKSRSLARRAGTRVSPRARSATFPNRCFVTAKPADRALTTWRQASLAALTSEGLRTRLPFLAYPSRDRIGHILWTQIHYPQKTLLSKESPGPSPGPHHRPETDLSLERFLPLGPELGDPPASNQVIQLGDFTDVPPPSTAHAGSVSWQVLGQRTTGGTGMRKVVVLAPLTLALAFAAPSGVSAGGGGSDGCGGSACHSVGGGGGGSRGGGSGGGGACHSNPGTDFNLLCHGGGGGRP